MLKRLRADLHIHSCLSPCADLEMSPRAIVEEAQKRGLNLIAICDHNSAENVWATIRAAQQTEVVVIPGMEITSREEVHLLGWFPTVAAALEVQAKVYGALPGTNNPDKFGLQVIANEHDEVMAFCERLLIGATTLTLEEIVRVIHRAGGLAVASHIDREGFGIIGQMGFIPPGLDLDALEVSRAMGLNAALEAYPEYASRFPLICASDAHRLDDMGRGVTDFECETPTFAELAKAVQGREARRIRLPD